VSTSVKILIAKAAGGLLIGRAGATIKVSQVNQKVQLW
jgi:hypothetical protein